MLLMHRTVKKKKTYLNLHDLNVAKANFAKGVQSQEKR